MKTFLPRISSLVAICLVLTNAYGQTPYGSPELLAPSQAPAQPRLTVLPSTQTSNSTTASAPMLAMVDMPSSYVVAVSTKLELKYRDTPGIHLSPDVRSGKLIIMAPPALQGQIQAEATQILFAEMQPPVQPASSISSQGRGADGSYQVRLAKITWREFEDSLAQVVGRKLPVTTSRNGEQATFQLTGAPLDGTTIEIDRRENAVTVIAPEPAMPGWRSMIQSLDNMPAKPGDVTEMVKITNAKPAPIQRAIRMLDALGPDQDALVVPSRNNPPFQNAVFQQPPGQAPAQDRPVQNAGPSNQPLPIPGDGATAEEGSGIIGDTQIQFVPELGIIIVRGAKRDTQRVLDVIKQIEQQSIVTQPEVEVYRLKNLDSAATADLLIKLYTDVLSARQGEVSVTALDNPNALLLIGRREALASAIALIEKIDTPADAASQLRVFRLENASALDAEETINNFFVDRPGQGDDVRPGLGTRVRVVADYRTNSLIVSASPRDMGEVARLILELDVQAVPAQNEIRVFPLKNSLAEDLAPVLQTAINGEGEATENDNANRASTSLSIVALDVDRGGVIDSGILAGVVVTADANANAIVVRGPSTSMPLISELIRQLDQVPGAESVVKVFTIENGDALKLTTSLQSLFAPSGSTGNTQVGAGNLAGLAGSTANATSSLVGLSFTTDQRTNSIIASGSANDLEVVESILLRLDTAGFAERITEVIWLRHQSAPEIATAIQTYVQQRTQTVNTIQQFQQGLGPFDLPDRDLVVVAEAVSNSLLLSVSPRLYDDVRRLIDSLDRRPPMVLIKVVLAEVTLGDQFELGGEIGLQDSLLFDRSVATVPATVLNPGFPFNNNGTPNQAVVSPGSIGERAVSTFGLGTQSSTLGYGGFVLSAASDSFNLLLRALQDANRAQILSRPQIMTVDNKSGFVQVGQRVARITDVINNGVAGSQVVTADIDIGLILEVLPRVGADGLISMAIRVERSSINPTGGTPISTTGTPVIIPNIDTTNAESTITAYSGQTVVFGGLIQKQRTNVSRRVPYLANIPLLGVLFRFDRETETRSELLVIMTPMLINGDEDLEYVKQVESSRMSYCLADVVEMHGDVGLSGGYGLWGPAVGPVIYPDLHPTIDQFPKNNVGETYGPSALNGPTAVEGEIIIDSSMSQPVLTAPMEPVLMESMQPSPGYEAIPPSVPRIDVPRSGQPVSPSDKRTTGMPFRSGSVTPASTSSSGQYARAADFKFIDEQAAAAMSGMNQEPMSKP
jgi:general secretion pathway protein D